MRGSSETSSWIFCFSLIALFFVNSFRLSATCFLQMSPATSLVPSSLSRQRSCRTLFEISHTISGLDRDKVRLFVSSRDDAISVSDGDGTSSEASVQRPRHSQLSVVLSTERFVNYSNKSRERLCWDDGHNDMGLSKQVWSGIEQE